MAIARYLIAQYIPDLLRHEPRNVGVITTLGAQVAARFAGEVESGDIDGRKIKSFAYPDIYRQWVQYWRSVLQNNAADAILPQLIASSTSHYCVVSGGEVSDIGRDSIEDVLNYLYALIVSEGRLLSAALGVREGVNVAASNLKALVGEEFQGANILIENEQQLPLVPHPIIRNVPLPSSAAEPHMPSFVQHNGLLYVMEIVDFFRDKERAKDRAGLASYMFEDLREPMEDQVRTISIVKNARRR